MAIAMLALGGISAMMWADSAGLAARYRAATACTVAQDAVTTNCYLVVPATIVDADVQPVRGGRRAYLHVQLQTGPLPVEVDNPGDAESVLVPGASTLAKVYRGDVVQLRVGSYLLTTSANPIRQDTQNQVMTFVGLGIGTLGIAFELNLLRRRRSKTATPIPMVGSSPSLTLANADMDALLRAESLAHPETISLPLLIRPQGKNTSTPVWIGFLLGAVTVAGIIFEYRIRGMGLVIVGVVVLGLVMFVIMLRRRYLSRTALFVEEHEAGVIRAYGERKVIPRAQISRIALRTVVTRNISSRRLIILGPDGRALVRVVGEGFSYDDAALFAAALRVPIDGTWDTVTSAAKLGKEIPGSVMVLESRGTVLAAVLAVVVLAVVMVIELRLVGH